METIKEQRKRKLEEEILKKQEELKKLETGEREGIIPIEQYTDKDKIEFFDRMYKFAISLVEELENKGYSDEDNDTWAFEETMEILNTKKPKEFWNYWNSLT